MTVDTKKWSKRLRRRGWHKTPRGLKVPLYSVTMDASEVEEFVEYLFVRAMYAYMIAASILGLKLQDIAKKPHHGKSTELHKKAYKIFNKAFGRIRLRVKNAGRTSKFYKYGLILSDGHVSKSRKMIQFGSTDPELIRIVLLAFKRAEVYILHPTLLRNDTIHPFIYIHIDNNLGGPEQFLSILFNATVTELVDYVAGLADGDGSISRWVGLRIFVGEKKLPYIEPISWMGRLHKSGKDSYSFIVYKEFQGVILRKMQHRKRKQMLKAVLQRKYRRNKFNGIKISVRNHRGVEVCFYGNINSIIKYAQMLGLKPSVHENFVRFNAKDTLILLKAIINPQIS